MTALPLLAARVPRYTSYPAALHFSHAVSRLACAAVDAYLETGNARHSLSA
jgi:hypothetical protein